ncbi:MAG: hypothetical protein KDK51_06590 [Deltaproteobacteria bacterium]|nr:hypothetical protein [Deltaproteobacteria bacterium]
MKKLSALIAYTLLLIAPNFEAVCASDAVTVVQPMHIQRDVQKRIIQIDFPYGQSIRYSYQTIDTPIPNQKTLIGFCLEGFPCTTTPITFARDDLSFHTAPLVDMHHRMEAIPDYIDFLMGLYPEYVNQYKELAVTKDKFITQILAGHILAIVGELFEYRADINQQEISEIDTLITKLEFRSLMEKVVNMHQQLKQIEEKLNHIGAYDDDFTRLDTGIQKPLQKHLSAIEKCNPTVGAWLQQLTSNKKLKVDLDQRNLPTVVMEYRMLQNENYIVIPEFIIREALLQSATLTVNTTDNYIYWSDKNFNYTNLGTADELPHQIRFDTIHEYGHYYTHKSYPSVGEKWAVAELSLFFVAHKSNSAQMFMTTSNRINAYSDLVRRIDESAANYFAVDAYIQCFNNPDLVP